MRPINWSNRVDRLRRSGRFDLERNIYIGDKYDDGLPHLVPTVRRNPHSHLQGGSRSGKGVLIAALATQAIADDASVVLIEIKNEPWIPETLRIECRNQDILFRRVDIRPGRRTHLFPFRQAFLSSQSFMAQADALTQAFGIDGGFDPTQAFFSTMDHRMLYASLVLRPEDMTPTEIAKRYKDPAAFDKLLMASEWKHASMSRSLMMRLTSVTAMNARAGSPGVSETAIKYAIDLRQLFDAPQVVCFSLDTQGQRATTRALAGYVAFLLMAAGASLPRVKPVKRVVCIIDDCQEVICGPHVGSLIDTAASVGVELVLAHQSPDQLRRGPHDISASLVESTGLQVIFSPGSEETWKMISNTSGTRVAHDLSWKQHMNPWFDATHEGVFDPKYAMGGPMSPPAVNVTQRAAPVWSVDTVRKLSTVENVAWVRLKYDQGLARYEGAWTPVFVPYQFSKLESEFRVDHPMPDPVDQTVLVDAVSDYDRSFEEAPPKPTPEPKKSPIELARERKREEEERRKKRK